jgi:hypothetical protein
VVHSSRFSGPVVEAIAVDVVDDLLAGQGSRQQLRHHEPVLELLPATGGTRCRRPGGTGTHQYPLLSEPPPLDVRSGPPRCGSP